MDETLAPAGLSHLRQVLLNRHPLFLILAAVLFLPQGCSYLPPAPDPSVRLAPSLSVDQSQAFQKALHSEPQSPALEKARLDYLLEVVGHSPYNFIRSGSRYNGQRAEIHFKWKYFRNRWQVKTAEEFIDRVATASKTTGQPYLVEFRGKNRYPLQPLLLRELQRFDREFKKRTQPAVGTEST